MSEYSKQDLVSTLDTISNKPLAWRGDACHCPFCEDKSHSAGIYLTDRWRFRCHQHGCEHAGPYDLYDLLSLREHQPIGEILKTRRDSTEGGRGRGHASAGGGRVQELYTSPTALKKKFSGGHVYLYRKKNKIWKNGDGQFPLSHGVIRYADPGSKSGKSYVQIKRVSDKVVTESSGLEVVTQQWCFGAPSKPWVLYNHHAVGVSKAVFVVEGEKCVDRVLMSGHVAVSSMGGAGKARYGDWSCLVGKDVYLWPDNDDAGYSHMRDVRGILSSLDCRVFEVVPSDLGITDLKADVCDYLDGISPRLWRMELESVKSKSRSCGPVASYVAQLKRIRSGELKSVPLPFVQLDDCCMPLSPGQLTCLCASPGKGKSLLLLQSMIHWHSLGVKFSCFMLEQSQEYHVGRLCAQLHGDAQLNSIKWLSESQENADYALSRVSEVSTELDAIASRITVPSASVCHSDVMSWVTSQAESGVRVMAIDPITAVDPVKNIWEADRELVFGIKKLCDVHGCSVIFVTHPRGGSSGVLNVDSMAGGQAYGRFSQCVLWITFLKKKEDFTCKTPCGSCSIKLNAVIHVVKASNGPGARKGIGFRWDGAALRWSEQGMIL